MTRIIAITQQECLPTISEFCIISFTTFTFAMLKTGMDINPGKLNLEKGASATFTQDGGCQVLSHAQLK